MNVGTRPGYWNRHIAKAQDKDRRKASPRASVWVPALDGLVTLDHRACYPGTAFSVPVVLRNARPKRCPSCRFERPASAWLLEEHGARACDVCLGLEHMSGAEVRAMRADLARRRASATPPRGKTYWRRSE